MAADMTVGIQDEISRRSADNMNFCWIRVGVYIEFERRPDAENLAKALPRCQEASIVDDNSGGGTRWLHA
jgi:hypothetical protein